MSAPARFLQALGKLVTSTGLYPGNHPARREAVEEASGALDDLLAGEGRVSFSFLEEKVIFGRQPLEGLGNWPWAARLNEVGVQRLELFEGVRSEELERFATSLALELGLVAASMTRSAEETLSVPGPQRHPNIQYGLLDVRAAPAEKEETPERPVEVAPLDLSEEVGAIAHVHEVVEARGEVPEAETAAIVGALLVAVRSARELVAPLVQIRQTDEYTTTHCMNVSLLAMSTAEFLRLSDADVAAIGESGLLHDIGKTRIPPEILHKPGVLTEEERRVVEHHVVAGARILMRSERRNPLAAVVAYEHHMHWDGTGGYPRPTGEHRPHRFSRLVQVCDVFDALRTRRPWRPAFSAEAALEFLETRKGSEFDPELVDAFLSMMRQWEPQLVGRETEAEEADPGVLGDGAADGAEAVKLALRAESSERGFDADMEGELYAS